MSEDRNTTLQVWEESKLPEIKKIFAPQLTDAEFRYFVGLGRTLRLNPFNREIWCVTHINKRGERVTNTFVGRDGYRVNAQRDANYDYHIVDAVYENDDFRIVDGAVAHSYNLKNRGRLVGAYCTVQRKSSTRPMYVFVELREYDLAYGNWKKMPATMIKKVAEAQALRMAFQSLFGGTYDESERWKIEEDKEAFPENIKPLLASEEQVLELEALMIDAGLDKKQILASQGIKDFTELTQSQAAKWIARAIEKRNEMVKSQDITENNDEEGIIIDGENN